MGDGAAPEELKLMLSGVRFLDGDKGGLDEDLEAAKAASEAQERMKVKDYAGAISALDSCLDIYPAYVPAILFRAEAKKASADFTGYREDLALAQEYDPSVEGANGPEAYAEEAKLAEAARDYEQACRSWATAYDKSSDAAYLKSFSRALNSYWTELKKDKEESYERKVRALEDAAEIQNLDREDEVKKVLASVYTTAANQAKAEKDYSKAFRYASKLKSLRGDYRDQGDKLRDQIKAAKDRDRK